MDKLFEKRWFGLVFNLITYILAIWLGVLIFLFSRNLNIFIRLLIADTVATVFVFVMGLLIDNASIYDPYWSVIPPVIVIGLMFHFSFFSAIHIIFATLVFLWGLRLTIHWSKTFKSLLYQDWRYDMLKARSKKWYPVVNFFGIDLFPTLLTLLGIFPSVYLMSKSEYNIFTIIGFIIMAIAIIIELVSDLQMSKFIKLRENEEEVINIGLWKYSRHPNYLGEIIFWLGIFISCVSVNQKAIWTSLGFVLIALMFIFISIPMIEKRLLFKKEKYKEYKRTTSMLLILPRKK